MPELEQEPKVGSETAVNIPYVLKFSGKKDNYDSGATRDAGVGRGRYDLISLHMLRRLAIIYEGGALNHGDRNWEKGLPFSRLCCSALRHITQFMMGMRDEDHLGQAIWNLSCIIHFQEEGREAELNDIPVHKFPGTT